MFLEAAAVHCGEVTQLHFVWGVMVAVSAAAPLPQDIHYAVPSCCLQVIDVKAQRLQNVITFPPSGAFIVDSSIAVERAQRVSFKFTSAKLKTASKDWGVPPFGQGW